MSYNRRTLSPDSPCAIAAALLFFAAAALRTVGFILSYSGTLLVHDLIIELFVPAVCCVIFGMMLISRKKSLIPTVFPLIGGSVFIVTRALGLELWQTVTVTALYAIFAIIYILTVTGIMGTRSVLMTACIAASLLGTISGLRSADGSPLGAITLILILAAIFCESIGMRRGRQY